MCIGIERNGYGSSRFMDKTTDKRLLPTWLWPSDNSRRRAHCKKAVARAMETRLTPAQRQRVELHFGKGMSKSEIARLENSSCSAVVKSIRAAEEAIRDYAEAYMEIYDALERELLQEAEAL